MRLSRKGKVTKVETFKVTHLLKDCFLGLLYLTDVVLRGVFLNRNKALQDLQGNFAAEKY